MGDRRKWKLCDDGVHIQRTGYGQEFVLDLDKHPQGRRWIADLFRRFRSAQPA